MNTPRDTETNAQTQNAYTQLITQINQQSFVYVALHINCRYAHIAKYCMFKSRHCSIYMCSYHSCSGLRTMNASTKPENEERRKGKERAIVRRFVWFVRLFTRDNIARGIMKTLRADGTAIKSNADGRQECSQDVSVINVSYLRMSVCTLESCTRFAQTSRARRLRQ